MKKHTRPFNHVVSSSFFRLACRTEFFDDSIMLLDAEKTIDGLKQLRDYEKQLRKHIKIRTSNFRGRRKSFDKLYAMPFTKASSRIYYSVAISIENMLEKHFQIKSGETYVLLYKTSMQFYDAVQQKYQSTLRTAAINNDNK